MDCPRMREISYSDFGAHLYRKARGRRIPWVGSIELTARCNLGCGHCYINVPQTDRNAQANELTASEAYDLIDQIADAGCLRLLLTGGELFVRPDALDIYTYAKKKGIVVTLFTNGTMITPRIADHLADLPPHSVEITLYGCTEETYSQVTGVRGAYSQCIRGIELLRERGIRVSLKTMVLTVNQHELGRMESYAGALGTDFRFDPMVSMRLDGDTRPKAFRLSPEQVVALDMRDDRRVRAWKEYVARYSGHSPQPDRLYQCAAGIGNFHIDPVGRLSACIIARTPSYDLRKGSFADGWNRFLPQVISQTRKRVTPCRTCSLNILCDQCPGAAQLECGDPETPVEYLCRIAHLRARALDMDSEGKEQNDVAQERRRFGKAAI